MIWDRRLKNGYSDLGPISIPPHGVAFVLTDRADGTKYLVSYNITSAVERLSINTVYSTIQKKEGVRIYAADDGPYMDEDGQYRIFVRAGRIGLDYAEFPRAVVDEDQAPPYSRTPSTQQKLIIRDTRPNPLRPHIGIKTDG